MKDVTNRTNPISTNYQVCKFGGAVGEMETCASPLSDIFYRDKLLTQVNDTGRNLVEKSSLQPSPPSSA